MWESLWLTVQLAAVSVVVLVLVGTPLAWWLARSRSRWVPVVAAAVALPLVLPPTVLGFYLLLALGPDSPLTSALASLGIGSLVFTFEGLVVASVIYSLHFMVQPVRYAFEAMGRRPLEVAATLRASPLDAFFSVALPLAFPGLLTGVIMSFAHTLGEFGVVLMVGGSIPGETRVVSIAIFERVEALQWGEAHLLSAVMLAVSFLALYTMTLLQRRLVSP